MDSEHFDGRTYSPTLDGKRLNRQLDAVKTFMTGRGFVTIAEIREVVEGSETGISARIRDLRKPQFGGHKIETERRGKGVWAYKLAA